MLPGLSCLSALCSTPRRQDSGACGRLERIAGCVTMFWPALVSWWGEMLWGKGVTPQQCCGTDHYCTSPVTWRESGLPMANPSGMCPGPCPLVPGMALKSKGIRLAAQALPVLEIDPAFGGRDGPPCSGVYSPCVGPSLSPWARPTHCTAIAEGAVCAMGWIPQCSCSGCPSLGARGTWEGPCGAAVLEHLTPPDGTSRSRPAPVHAAGS